MKKVICTALMLILTAAMFFGCAGGGPDVTSSQSGSQSVPSNDMAGAPEQGNNENTNADENTNKGNTDPAHTHTYGEWKNAGEANCTTGAAKERVCLECGAKETVYGMPAGHKMKNNVCEICGAGASEGLDIAEYNVTCYVTGIGDCKDTDIIIPDTYNGKPVSDIDEKAFKGNKSIKSVTVPENVTRIGSYAFSECSNLHFVFLPDSLDYIDLNAFYWSGLYTVTIPENVSTVRMKAFLACSRLIELKNLSSLSFSLGSDNNGHAAYYAESIITEGDPHIYYSSYGYYFYDNNGKTVLLGYDGSDTELLLPSDLNGRFYDLSESCFRENTTLKSVEIREGTENIGAVAFENCTSLTTVKLPSTLKQIGTGAFRGCKAISTVIYNGKKDAWTNVKRSSGNELLWDREITYLG